eukprot:TRINITY_DN38055_c0_g1_i1.p1 TRINITY_DN38055_c0_g1~~TRINITY_DN38055_c0_g1_i1.p1  ORF type:complete len:699 (+),score=53.97 TRINITY_DN38055_c0_g1_i1:28-2097(+)
MAPLGVSMRCHSPLAPSISSSPLLGLVRNAWYCDDHAGFRSAVVEKALAAVGATTRRRAERPVSGGRLQHCARGVRGQPDAAVRPSHGVVRSKAEVPEQHLRHAVRRVRPASAPSVRVAHSVAAESCSEPCSGESSGSGCIGESAAHGRGPGALHSAPCSSRAFINSRSSPAQSWATRRQNRTSMTPSVPKPASQHQEHCPHGNAGVNAQAVSVGHRHLASGDRRFSGSGIWTTCRTTGKTNLSKGSKAASLRSLSQDATSADGQQHSVQDWCPPRPVELVCALSLRDGCRVLDEEHVVSASAVSSAALARGVDNAVRKDLTQISLGHAIRSKSALNGRASAAGPVSCSSQSRQTRVARSHRHRHSLQVRDAAAAASADHSSFDSTLIGLHVPGSGDAAATDTEVSTQVAIAEIGDTSASTIVATGDLVPTPRPAPQPPAPRLSTASAPSRRLSQHDPPLAQHAQRGSPGLLALSARKTSLASPSEQQPLAGATQSDISVSRADVGAGIPTNVAWDDEADFSSPRGLSSMWHKILVVFHELKHDGEIHSSQLSTVLQTLGYGPAPKEVWITEAMQSLTPFNTVDAEELFEVIKRYDELEEEAQADAFEEVDDDEDGCIDVLELTAALRILGLRPRQRLVDNLSCQVWRFQQFRGVIKNLRERCASGESDRSGRWPSSCKLWGVFRQATI